MGKIQVLIATMHQEDYSLLDKMNIVTDAVVINQCDKENRKEFIFKGNKILWIDSKNRGLSNSRNLAIENSWCDYCLISDDDMIYNDDYISIVDKAFKTEPQASIIAFKVMGIESDGIERSYKNYANYNFKVGYLKSMKISSVEIAFKREKIIEKRLKFDNRIGAGTKFLMGEESAFLFHAIRMNLNIFYFPEIIAKIHIGNSTWFKGYNDEYFIGKGAAFEAMETPFTNLLIFQFAIRKYRLYSKNVSFLNSIKSMLKGKKEYLLEKAKDK